MVDGEFQFRAFVYMLGADHHQEVRFFLHQEFSQHNFIHVIDIHGNVVGLGLLQEAAGFAEGFAQDGSKCSQDIAFHRAVLDRKR